MKKIFLMTVAVAISATAVANSFVVSDSNKVVQKRSHTLNSSAATRDEDFNYEYGKPIYEIPEGGTYSLYNRSSDMFYYNFGETVEGTDKDFAGEVVTYPNGDVYIRNMVPSMADGSWLKGRKEGDKIVMEFPQVLCWEVPHWEDGVWVTDGFWPIFVADYTIDYDKGELDVWVNENTQTYEFTIKEDGSIVSSDPKKMLGVFTQGGIWYQESVWNYNFATFDDKTIELPDNLNFEDWAFAYRENASMAKVAFDGNDVYFKGFYSSMPDALVKGSLEDGVMKFESRQFMGVDEATWHLAYFIGTYNTGKQLKISDFYEFNYDSEKNIYVGKEHYMMANAGKESVYYLAAFYDPTLKKQAGDVKLGKPQNPWFEMVESPTKNPNTGELEWYVVTMIPCLDVNGYLLDTNRMWYNFFFDDEIFLFDPQDYGLVQDSSDVPYNYSDGWNIYCNGYMHQVYFYFEGIEKIAIQSVFEDEDGNIYKSDMVVYGDNSVNEIPSADIRSISWYNLQGSPVTNPEKGIFIKQMHLNDGSVITQKVILK